MVEDENIAVILLNLGGPSNLDLVEPFLFSLFSDKNILRLPYIFRIPIAKFISLSRSKKAKYIYSKIGGKSPILDETLDQAKALNEELKNQKGNFKIFICMRHASPKVSEVIKEIDKFNPNKIILLPLYPHFSSTTTLSSFEDFKNNYKGSANIISVCCYPQDKNFIKSHVELIKEGIKKLKSKNFRILFSAHSLPEGIIKSGDPYKWQTEKSVEEIVRELDFKNLDYKISYQSKVGPVKWLEPSTEDEIKKAAQDKKSIIVVPISFVSEHSETLVELDIDYKNLACKFGAEYLRIPTVSINKFFIKSLTKTVEEALNSNKQYFCLENKTRLCPSNFKFCPC